MAAKNELQNAMEHSQAEYPQKIVIVAGPSFGSAMKFLLLGAALGALGVHYLGNKSGATGGVDATGEAAEDRAARLLDRLSSLSRRVKGLAGRARESTQHARETLGPAWSEAVAEARVTSQATQQQLEEDLHRTSGETVKLADTSVATEQA